MLRWLSSKGRHSRTSSGTSLYRVSLDLPNDTISTVSSAKSSRESSPAKGTARSTSSALQVPENVPRGKELGRLRRHSLPALHLQEDQSAAMMSNPPVFTNPLRRRGCCDHQHTQQMYQYRAEAIQREKASEQASFRVPLQAA